MEGTDRFGGGLVAVSLVSSPGSVVPSCVSICGRQSASVPGAAAARAAAWHNSSVWKVFITACGLAGLPVSESTTRMYPEARILGEAPPVTSLAWPRSPRNRLPSIPVTKKLTRFLGSQSYLRPLTDSLARYQYLLSWHSHCSDYASNRSIVKLR